ncbi:MAG: tetratricopeptide repeat protein [Brumimicrobium sp.]
MIKFKSGYLLYILTTFLFVACDENKPDKSGKYYTDSEKTDTNSLQALADSVEKNPDNIKLWIKLGELCKEDLNFKCALDAGARAYMLDSTNLDARKLYAWSLINKPQAPLEDIERSKKHYKYVLSVKKNDPETMVNLANTYSLTGDFKTAIKYINDALRIDEEYRDAYVLKGSIYKTMEKFDLALSSYQTAVQIDPDYFIGHLQIGWLLTEMEDHKLALEYYENAAELKPKNLNATYGIAKSLQDLGKYDKALAGYRTLLRNDSTAYVAYFNQGYIKHYYQEELDSAVYFYNRLLDEQPEYIHGWYQIGEAYFAQGRQADAARAFSKALRIDDEYEPAIEASQKLR